jgi:hypothetical protein
VSTEKEPRVTKLALLFKRLYTLCVALIVLAAAGMGYRLVRTTYESDVYRERLGALTDDYQTLRGQYNQAIKRTAVTELLVQDGQLQVTVRDAAGELRCIPTPFDPRKEIFVDYVVIDSRLWIRRVFDEDTPPSEALVVDPKWADIDWNAPTAKVGKAVYRSIEEGRWIITVTGDGSLGLARHDDTTPQPRLESAPPIREFGPIDEEVNQVLGDVTAGEVIKRIVGGQ